MKFCCHEIFLFRLISKPDFKEDCYFFNSASNRRIQKYVDMNFTLFFREVISNMIAHTRNPKFAPQWSALNHFRRWLRGAFDSWRSALFSPISSQMSSSKQASKQTIRQTGTQIKSRFSSYFLSVHRRFRRLFK